MSSRCPVGASILPLFLSLVSVIQGATLREHRLNEPGSYEPESRLHPSPSAEMLRALRYIQSLSQRTPSDAPMDTDLDPDDMRSMLRLARGSTGMERDPEEREDGNDKTQQWLQAVLTTLQQTEEQMVPQKSPQRKPPRPRYAIQTREQHPETSSAESYERSSWGAPSIRRGHRQYPLMFEDEDQQEAPLKRTNENAEKQYTPQKLATLQSVFEELSGISTGKTDSKRESEDEELYRRRKMALDDIMGMNEWEPLDEQKETEEEQRDDDEDDDDEEEEDAKRSNQADFFQSDNEDVAKLVDLLKRLESKEQKREDVIDGDREEEKSDDDEERDEEEREIRPLHESFPQSLSQLITISQRLRIPPADVLDLLQNNARNFRTASRSRAPPRGQTSQRNAVAQDLLSILELVSAAQQSEKRPPHTKPSRYYRRERDLPGYDVTGRDDYDDTAGEEDELAGFLASEMQGPKRPNPSLQRRSAYGSLGEAVRDYFDKNAAEKRAEESLDDDDDGGDAMMRILRFLEPESDDETDSENKSGPEM